MKIYSTKIIYVAHYINLFYDDRLKSSEAEEDILMEFEQMEFVSVKSLLRGYFDVVSLLTAMQSFGDILRWLSKANTISSLLLALLYILYFIT